MSEEKVSLSYLRREKKFQKYQSNVENFVISREIRRLAALYPPPPYKKVLYRAPLSVIARGCMLKPTAFTPLFIVSL